MELSATRHGRPGTSPALLMAHGLFGAGRNFGAVARQLAEGREVCTVDMRNHGDSPWSDRHDYPAMAGDLAAFLNPGAPGDVLGHSMGGKAAMALALEHPGRVRRLVVADIAPVTYEDRQGPLLDAMRRLDLSHVARRSDADRALARDIPDAGIRGFLLQSLDAASGRWKLNLAALAGEMPSILGFPDYTGSFEGPALFLSGGASDYVLPEHRAAIRARFPAARFVKIPAAGHWLHADAPEAFAATVAAFLDA
jgi:pimeloyl-ACP methyl ester carboxylesterase